MEPECSIWIGINAMQASRLAVETSETALLNAMRQAHSRLSSVQRLSVEHWILQVNAKESALLQVGSIDGSSSFAHRDPALLCVYLLQRRWRAATLIGRPPPARGCQRMKAGYSRQCPF